MAKYKEKREALILRRKGLSIRGISTQLGVSKSTVSLWCEDIILNTAQKNVLHKNMIKGGLAGRMIGTSLQKEKRNLLLQKANKEAEKIIGKLSERDIFMVSLGLYWGEGSKNKERKFVFTNSDSVTIKYVIQWLTFIGIDKKDLVASIYINKDHEDRIKKVKSFWLKEISFKDSQFRKTILVNVPLKKVYENRETYFGVLRLTVKRSTYLKALIMSMLSEIKNKV